MGETQEVVKSASVVGRKSTLVRSGLTVTFASNYGFDIEREYGKDSVGGKVKTD